MLPVDSLFPAPVFRLVAGVDEAGRGPLAGPVSVAAVILDPDRPIDGLNDSKQLTETQRETLYPLIIERALAWRVEFVHREEIDQLNILQATMEGMRRAVRALQPAAELARIDGNRIPTRLSCPAEALVGGDRLDAAIMAASILAKVTRDRAMVELHAQFPQYGFANHKGYSTPEHLSALTRHGPCPQHRRSFAPVRVALEAHGMR
ncbi:ribonuclease HII [Pseudoxanthomonas beigongshangi]